MNRDDWFWFTGLILGLSGVILKEMDSYYALPLLLLSLIAITISLFIDYLKGRVDE